MRRLLIREAEVARAVFVVADLLKLPRLPSGLEAVLQLLCLDAQLLCDVLASELRLAKAPGCLDDFVLGRTLTHRRHHTGLGRTVDGCTGSGMT